MLRRNRKVEVRLVENVGKVLQEKMRTTDMRQRYQKLVTKALADPDVKSFLQAHRAELTQEDIERSASKLYEYVKIKENIAYLSGNTKLYDTLSTYELLKMCAEIYGIDDKKAEERIKEITDAKKYSGYAIYQYLMSMDLLPEELKKANLYCARSYVPSENDGVYISEKALDDGILSSEVRFS